MDDLQLDGLVLYQDTGLACFSADAIALAAFLRLRPNERVVELGAGTGVICVLGAHKTGARFTGVERQARLVELAQKSARKNGQQIEFVCCEAKDAPGLLGRGAFNAAVMNPPYFISGDQSPNESAAEARHAERGALEEFLAAAFQLLDNGGRLFLIYPAAELTTLLCALRAQRLEPKRIRFATTGKDGAPLRVLAEAKKLGGPGLVVEPSVPLQPDAGQ